MTTNRITWVLQQGAIGPRDHGRLVAEIGAQRERIEEVSVIPLVHEPAGALPEIDGPCLVYGSSGLLAMARRQGWRPAGWDGEGFAAAAVARALGPLALNGEARLTTWSEAAVTARAAGWTRVFVRPDAETKEFPGRVLSVEDLADWVERLRSVGYIDARDAAAIVAPARSLGREWRLFVVDDRVVASAQYASAGELALGPQAPAEAISLARAALARHSPAPALVMDVGEVKIHGHWELRVVELNSINSAGFYCANLRPIVDALSGLVGRR